MATKIKLAPSNVAAAAIADIDAKVDVYVDVDVSSAAVSALLGQLFFSPASFAIIFQFCRLLINFLAFFARPPLLFSLLFTVLLFIICAYAK